VLAPEQPCKPSVADLSAKATAACRRVVRREGVPPMNKAVAPETPSGPLPVDGSVVLDPVQDAVAPASPVPILLIPNGCLQQRLKPNDPLVLPRWLTSPRREREISEEAVHRVGFRGRICFWCLCGLGPRPRPDHALTLAAPRLALTWQCCDFEERHGSLGLLW
jgi:hypothetical protein